MFKLQIGNTPVIFVKAFKDEDRESILEFVRAQAEVSENRKVLFIDTPATPRLVQAIETLHEEGIEIHVRDHHGLAPDALPTNSRELETVDATTRLAEILGQRSVISYRDAHPACSELVNVGEFSDALCIVADPDADGLTGAMKALGITYPGIDQDAAIMDGPRSQQLTGSLTSQLLLKALRSLPPANTNAGVAESAMGEVFEQWIAMVQGDCACEVLKKKAVAWEVKANAAEVLATSATKVATSVWFVDTVDAPPFDLGVLNANIESQPGCLIIATRKADGPIAKLAGTQISLCLSAAANKKVNLQQFLSEGFVSSPEAGIISNTTFLLHVSEDVWNTVVLPKLLERFGHA